MQPIAVWDLPALPFIYRPLESPHNPTNIPDVLPFRLAVDAVTGRLVQQPTDELATILERAYAEGSMITGLIDESGIGREYAEDFLGYVSAALERARLDGLRVLDIGCGGGYLLHRMHELDADVCGVEPGPLADEGALRYGIDIRRGFFPGVETGNGYDLAVLYCLLEHIPDPAALLLEVARVVRPGGRVLVAVPDAEPYVRAGDVSVLFHEHYSYFTASTLRSTVLAAGAADVEITHSRFSNLLFASYTPAPAGELLEDLAGGGQLAEDFRGRAEAMVTAVWRRIDDVREAGGCIGIFVPARVANILAMRGESLEGIRFFDDNEKLTGTYYPGIPVPVEKRAALLANPPTSVLIMSLSFGDRIAESLQAQLPPSVEVVQLASLLAT